MRKQWLCFVVFSIANALALADFEIVPIDSPPASPKSMKEMVEGSFSPKSDEPPGKKLVHICYPAKDKQIEKACKTLRDKMTRCGFEVTQIDNPTSKKDIQDRLGKKGLSPNTPVFLSGHGINRSVGFDNKWYVGVENGLIENPKLTGKTPTGIKIDLFDLGPVLQEIQDTLGTKDHKVPMWLSFCHSQGGCDQNKHLCTGASCLRHQFSGMLPDYGYLDPAEVAFTELLCDPKKFKSADKITPDHVLSTKELNQYLCERFGGKLLKAREFYKTAIADTSRLEEDFDHPISELETVRKKLETEFPEKKILYRKLGQSYQVHYTKDGKEEIMELGSAYSTKEEAKEHFEQVYRHAAGIEGPVRLTKSGVISVLEVKDNAKDIACYQDSLGMDQTFYLNNFFLVSPQSPATPETPERTNRPTH